MPVAPEPATIRFSWTERHDLVVHTQFLRLMPPFGYKSARSRRLTDAKEQMVRGASGGRLDLKST
jgi:hypothetical protein